MSYPYTLNTPINIYSSSSNGQIKLFNGATFSSTLQAGTMTSSFPFVLPPNNGNDGNCLRYDTSSTKWGVAPIDTSANTPTGSIIFTGFNTQNIPISIHSNGATPLSPASTTSTTFVRIGLLRFRGTSIDGSPNALRAVIGGVATTGTVSVRIFDFTNSVTIGTSTGVTTSTTPQLVTIPITNPFPLNQAIIEYQLSVVGGGTAQIWHLHFLY